MNRMTQPLAAEPPCAKAETNEAINYTEGFHDGAYALAKEPLDVLRLYGDGSVKDALELFERREARPVEGWAHEPSQK